MAMEEQRTPPKAVRGGISKEDDDKRPRSQQNSAGKQTSAALYSPFKPVIKSVSCMSRGSATSFPLQCLPLAQNCVCVCEAFSPIPSIFLLLSVDGKPTASMAP